MREVLALAKHGVPWDLCLSLSNDERVAFLIICGEIDGGTFDWNKGEWEKPA